MNINCVLNCEYQKDGKCFLNNLKPTNLASENECIYFKDKQKDKK